MYRISSKESKNKYSLDQFLRALDQARENFLAALQWDLFNPRCDIDAMVGNHAKASTHVNVVRAVGTLEAYLAVDRSQHIEGALNVGQSQHYHSPPCSH